MTKNITVTLKSEVMNGWGWEVIATDSKHNVLEHTDVGYFDLDDWLTQRFGLANFKIVNLTDLQ